MIFCSLRARDYDEVIKRGGPPERETLQLPKVVRVNTILHERISLAHIMAFKKAKNKRPDSRDFCQ